MVLFYFWVYRDALQPYFPNSAQCERTLDDRKRIHGNCFSFKKKFCWPWWLTIFFKIMSIYTLLKGWVFLYSWKVEYFYTHKKIVKHLSWQTPPRDLYLNPVYIEIRSLYKSKVTPQKRAGESQPFSKWKSSNTGVSYYSIHQVMEYPCTQTIK